MAQLATGVVACQRLWRRWRGRQAARRAQQQVHAKVRRATQLAPAAPHTLLPFQLQQQQSAAYREAWRRTRQRQLAAVHLMTVQEVDEFMVQQAHRCASLLQSCWRRKVAVRRYEQLRKVRREGGWLWKDQLTGLPSFPAPPGSRCRGVAAMTGCCLSRWFS